MARLPTLRFAPMHVIRLPIMFAVVAVLSGCGTPLALVGLASALVGGGEPRAAPSTGAFAGTPTVQNAGRPDPGIAEAVQTASAPVLEQCRRQLPEQAALAPGSCVVRATCLPGVQTPLRLRVCTPLGPLQASAASPDA